MARVADSETYAFDTHQCKLFVNSGSIRYWIGVNAEYLQCKKAISETHPGCTTVWQCYTVYVSQQVHFYFD